MVGAEGDGLTEWQPTPNMVAFVKHLQAHDYEPSIPDASQAIGISKQAAYLWWGKPDFRRWFQDQVERHFGLKLGKVASAAYKAAVQQTGKGDARYSPAAIKLFLERFDKGYAPRTQQDIRAHADVAVDPVMLERIRQAAMAPGGLADVFDDAPAEAPEEAKER